jgi:hypothetical protein
MIAEREWRYEAMLERFNGHRSGDEFISFAGNGYIGLR